MQDILTYTIAVVLPSGVFSYVELKWYETFTYVYKRKVVFTYLVRKI